MSQNSLLIGLPEEERARLAPHLEDIDVEFGQKLVEFNQPIKHVLFPDDCVTSTVVDAINGAAIEVGLMGTEGMVGLSLLFGIDRSNATVIVQLPGRATRMRAEAFRREVVERGGDLRGRLMRYANYFYAMVQQHAACNTTHPVDERMCRWILLTHDRAGREKFPLTQEFLANMLGVRRPSLSKIAHGLKREGLIDYTRGSVTVVDRDGLEERACECYRIIVEQMRLSLGRRGLRRNAA